MQINRKLDFLEKKKIVRFSILGILLMSFFLLSFFQVNGNRSPEWKDSNFPEIKSGSNPEILFQGNEMALNITDYGNLYKTEQQVDLTNNEEVNLTYYLDDSNNWEVDKIETNIVDLKDTRNWINNSEIEPTQIFRKYQVYESNGGTHPYASNHDAYSSIEHTITEDGAYFIRVHFVESTFIYLNDPTDSDFMVVYNGTYSEVLSISGSRTNFYSPWGLGDTLLLSYESDNNPITRAYGYYIDYYEFINASSYSEINTNTWQARHSQSGDWGSNTYGFGNISSVDAMFLGYHGGYWSDLESFVFYEDTFTELFQENITVPRGNVLDAYLSFDYYAEYALDTNNIIMYMSINGERVYSKGLLDINIEGKGTWHQTDKVPMYLWINQTNVFPTGVIKDESLNVSIGIRSLNSVIYRGYDDGNANLIWIDNVVLELTTMANATQDGIELTIDGFSPTNQNEWGKATLNLTQGWNTDPIIISLNSTSPYLEFNLNTTLYGYHKTTSKIGQSTLEGINYEILENGTIYWKFYHNFYMPAQYSEFEFVIEKPDNWNFLTVLDPTLQSRSYENGGVGDSILHITKEDAIFPGWWTFEANSPNYLNILNTQILKDGEPGSSEFRTGENAQIKTQVNYSNEIPLNLESTFVNLTVYDPDGLEWFYEAKAPLSNGTVFFSELYFDALNTSGGQYNYTLFWSNGTSLGGLNSNFLVVHESSFSLLKPNDAISDLITDAFVGDIIPVRIKLKDSENNNSISDAIISFNWTSGTLFFEEAALGIYETILDTSDLGSNGFYEILIESTKLGFFDYNLTLKINLGEETGLQRLQSDYNIELHANSTIRFRYYSLLDEHGIDGASITVNITNPDLYYITNPAEGIYEIEFNTSFINDLGIFQLNFDFDAPAYEPQNHIYQFEIIAQSVEISTCINNIEIAQNSIIEVTYMEEINISSQSRAGIDDNLLTGGNFTWIINSYQQSLDEVANYWYNSTIQINPAIYVVGLNLISIKFEMENYQTEIFYFQLLVDSQPVVLSVNINSQEISENEIYEVMYMESITISVRAFATIESSYISGAVITWHGGIQDQILTETGSYWYNASIQLVPANYTPGLNSIAIEFKKDNYQTEIFYFQLLVYEQGINFALYLDSNEISENQLVEIMFKQNITISAHAYGIIDLNYIDSATITWNSESYNKNFIEYGGYWYNLSFTISALNFSSGINTVSIKFQKQNYITTYFSFQLLVKEQSVQLNASINNEPILENALIEVMFKENITIATQAYAMGEGIYLSGGNMTLICEYYTFVLTEEISNPTWFVTSIIIDGAYFDLGVNTVSIRYKQDNYTEAYFSFQFLITAETVNLSLYLNSKEVLSNNLIQVTYYDSFSLSLRALANAEKVFLESGSAIFVIGSHSQDFSETTDFWYNMSVFCDPSYFNLGINTVYIQFTHPNYTLAKFYFQILVIQIEINAITIGFQDSIEGVAGDSLNIRINLTESISAYFIENATISYSWEFGLGNFEYLGNGIYELNLHIPENVQGSYKVSLIISSDNILYKVKQTSFIVVISAKQLPNFIFWIALIGLSIAISVLGSLSIRSYVLIPRKRKKEARLLSRTQRFKDLQNIQAMVVIHRYSGIPLYSKSYSILEKQKKELFSGFIQAITTIGEEIVGKKDISEDVVNVDESDKTRTILELDFKYFYCLICDRQDLRIVFVLKEKASERLKKQISDLSLGLMLQLGQQIESWDGAIDKFDSLMPPIISNYIELYLKETFTLNSPAYIADTKKEEEFSTMEKRVLNVIYSMVKSKSEFYLDYIVESVHENNKNIVIDAIESLVQKKIIIPSKK